MNMRFYRAWTGACVLLMLGLAMVSAYLRLARSGLGCSDWPRCYGDLHSAAAQLQSYPIALATHRLLASVLGIGVLTLVAVGLLRRRHGAPLGLPLAALALVVSLAALGRWSSTLLLPAVTVGNLLGGLALLGVLSVLWLTCKPPQPIMPPVAPPRLALTALLLLVVTVMLGALASAHFAAVACAGGRPCFAAPFGQSLHDALQLTRALTTDANGHVRIGAQQAAALFIHILAAGLTATMASAAAMSTWRSSRGNRHWGYVLGTLLLAEIASGIALNRGIAPLAMALAHNTLTALLLLAVLALARTYKVTGLR